MQVVLIVRCYGKGLLLVRTHRNVVKQRFSRAVTGVMEIHRGAPSHIYVANLSAKAVLYQST